MGFSSTFLLLLLLRVLCPARAADTLKEQFLNPPHEYTLQAFWAWNGTLDEARLKRQIDWMIEQDVHGAYLHTRAGLDESATPYFSPRFWDAVGATVEYARKRNFQAWLYDEDKWPSGAAGGRTIRANPERNRGKGLALETADVTGPRRQALNLSGAKYILAARAAGEQGIDGATVVDLTAAAGRGEEWSVPAGSWRLLTFRVTHGAYELPNYLNPATVREFLENTYEQYAARFAKHFGKTIPGVFFDEIHNIPLAWDPLLEERFKAAKGYELRDILPLLFLDGGPRAVKARCDYFEVFSKLYEEAWFRQISEWCARHNLEWTGHTNEGLSNIKDQGDYFRTMRHLQISGTDNEDFRYTFPRVVGSWKPKQIASIAHLYGRKRVMVEALGGAGWPITLDEARYGVNMLAVYGINYYIFHLFHYQMETPESQDDWPNSWFYQNPYWTHFHKLARHTSRLSFLGSQGEHVADVAVLYPVEEVWSKGLGPTEPLEVPGIESDHSTVQLVAGKLVDTLARHQIDSDLVDTGSLVKASPAAGGRARIGAETYRVILLPGVETVSLAAYRGIQRLAASGVKVAALGVVPRHSAENGADDPEVMRISAHLFGSAGALRDAAATINFIDSSTPRDVRVVHGAKPEDLRYLHRRVGQREVYFVVNGQAQAREWRMDFAASGSVERWDPETGAITSLPIAARAGNRTAIDLSFKPWGAYYVVFDRTASPPAVAAAKEPTPLVALDGAWTLEWAPGDFTSAWKESSGATLLEVPVAEVRFDPATRWRSVRVSDPLNPKQGAARYLTSWNAAWITRYDYNGNFPGELGGDELEFRRWLDLAEVPTASRLVVAAGTRFEVRINGVAAGAGEGWARPAVFENLPLRKGRNQIEVVVRGGGFLLAEGEAMQPDGARVPIETSGEWQVRKPSEPWTDAYEFTSPPMGKWGDVPLPGGVSPKAVWYRVRVPHGATSMNAPRVRGAYSIEIAGRPAQAPVAVKAGETVSLRVELREAGDGLLAPIEFRCGAAPTPLRDWRELGMEWYSGRAAYRTRFVLASKPQHARLLVDLGKLNYSGEIWLNGRKVDTLAWAPYRADITEFARVGENQLTVVVANLLANRMRWEIFDSAVSNIYARWWHDGNILREPDKLRSGLFGPVQLLKAED
jgi:hypothetical protein